jgi:hypothetical protein
MRLSEADNDELIKMLELGTKLIEINKSVYACTLYMLFEMLCLS